MKKKKYKVIRNNRNIYAIKELGNKGYWNNKVKRLIKAKKKEVSWWRNALLKWKMELAML